MLSSTVQRTSREVKGRLKTCVPYPVVLLWARDRTCEEVIPFREDLTPLPPLTGNAPTPSGSSTPSCLKSRRILREAEPRFRKAIVLPLTGETQCLFHMHRPTEPQPRPPMWPRPRALHQALQISV